LVCEKIVEGAISETSKVWQLETFELSPGRTVVMNKQTILKTVFPNYLTGEHEEEPLQAFTTLLIKKKVHSACQPAKLQKSL
jgi:hypothetical protein